MNDENFKNLVSAFQAFQFEIYAHNKNFYGEIDSMRKELNDVQEFCLNLREILNGSIRSTIKVSESLRDGLLEIGNKISEMESKKGGV